MATTRLRLVAAWAALGVLGTVNPVLSQEEVIALEQQPGIEILAAGPVHEAFAEPAIQDPSATPLVSKAPPEPIEELPPDVKPEGNAIWVSGYWFWDDDRNDFIWVSGAWRIAPEGQRWVAGYWTQTSGGWQWAPGLWADEEQQELAYFPEPPASLEEGPNVDAPSDDHLWIAGNWVYRDNRYVWSPGYWSEAQPNWVWTPSRYVWSPAGYVYCAGYWDRPLENRGWLFSPIAYTSNVYSRPDYTYTPQVLVNLGALATQLFVRPRWNSYYFGNYYAAEYSTAGYYPWYRYAGGYDPIFVHQRWYNSRRNPAWFRNVENQWAHYRDNPSARPARVVNWQNLRGGSLDRSSINNHLAVSVNQFVRANNVHVDRIQSDRRQQYARYSRDLRDIGHERQRFELRDGDRNAGRGQRRQSAFRLPDSDRRLYQQLTGSSGRNDRDFRDRAGDRDFDRNRREGSAALDRRSSGIVDRADVERNRQLRDRSSVAPGRTARELDPSQAAARAARDSAAERQRQQIVDRARSDHGVGAPDRPDSDRFDRDRRTARESLSTGRGIDRTDADRARADFERSQRALQDARRAQGVTSTRPGAEGIVGQGTSAGRQGTGPRPGGVRSSDESSAALNGTDQSRVPRREALRIPLSSTPNSNRGGGLERRASLPNQGPGAAKESLPTVDNRSERSARPDRGAAREELRRPTAGGPNLEQRQPARAEARAERPREARPQPSSPAQRGPDPGRAGRDRGPDRGGDRSAAGRGDQRGGGRNRGSDRDKEQQ